MKKLLSLMISAVLLMLAGCQGVPTYTDTKDDQFIKANYQATDALMLSANEKQPLDFDTPLMVATVVSIDKLNESSRLGRIISEQIQARLTNSGYAVYELKLRDSLMVKKATGELLLSRELKDLTATHNAQAVVVGTYAVANRYVYVNLKVVGPNNVTMGAYDYTLPLNNNVRAMLKLPKVNQYYN